MRCVILILKVFDKLSMRYYSVSKAPNYEEISCYMGLDAAYKKIYFYKEQTFQNPLGIYDLQKDGFEMYDPILSNLISGHVIMKGIKALRANEFPQDISWEG